jgi:hypothetical protein
LHTQLGIEVGKRLVHQEHTADGAQWRVPAHACRWPPECLWVCGRADVMMSSSSAASRIRCRSRARRASACVSAPHKAAHRCNTQSKHMCQYTLMCG